MLQLFIDNEQVDLLPDASITIDEESPVFEKDTIPGGYSYPFSLPITPRNRRILAFPERIEKQGAMSTEKPFQLFYDGQLRFSGTILITEAGTQYKANLMVGTGNLASRIKDVKLKDLDLGGERTWEWLAEYAYPDSDFALFPVYNTKLYDGSPYSDRYINNKYRLNSYESGVFYYAAGDAFAVSPFPFLGYIVRKIMSQYGFQIAGNCLESNKDFRDLVIYSNYDITKAITTIEMVETFVGTDQFGDEITVLMPEITFIRELNTFNLVDALPDMLITDFLLSLRSLLNIAFVFDAQDHVWIMQRQDYVMRLMDRDITAQAIGIPQLLSALSTSGFKLTWEHDNDDLLFKNGFLKIEDVLDKIKDPVADTEELAALTPDFNEIRLVVSLDAYYQFALNEETLTYKWTKWSIGYQNYLSGLMQETFETKFSTLMMVTYQREVAGPLIRCPWTEQVGNSIEQKDYKAFSPRLLFYRGMQLDSDNDPSPMGSSDNLDRIGTQLTGKNLCLKWEGEFGLYEQLWKNYLTWWMARKQVTWYIKDPSDLSFTKKYAIQGNHYLLKKRTVNLTQRGVEPGECEFYLV